MSQHVKRQVENLMRLDQKYRDSDVDLLIKIWEENGLSLTAVQRAIMHEVPAADMVIRRRRELSTKYPPSPLVAEKRYKNYTVLVAEFSPQNWLQRIIKRKAI